MNPKLNVWMLRTEPRYMKIDGKRTEVYVKVLRNEHGQVLGGGRTRDEDKELRKQYEQYNKRTKTEDLLASKTLRRKLFLTKNRLMKKGFRYRELCYGIWVNPETAEQEYKRMEVFKATPWNRQERQRIWAFFKQHVPKDNIAIYVVHKTKLYKRMLNSSG